MVFAVFNSGLHWLLNDCTQANDFFFLTYRKVICDDLKTECDGVLIGPQGCEK